MTAPSRLSALMEELGPAFGPAVVVHDPSEPLWTVAFDDGACVTLALDTAMRAETVVLGLPLGAPPEAAAGRAHELLLRFNHLWRETGGAYASVDEAGEAFLLFRHPLDGLDVRGLHGLIAALVRNRALWAAMLERVAPDDPLDAAAFAAQAGGIRV